MALEDFIMRLEFSNASISYTLYMIGVVRAQSNPNI